MLFTFCFFAFYFFSFLLFVALSYKLCYNIFVSMVLTKHNDLLSEFLFALFLLLMFEYLLEYLL